MGAHPGREDARLARTRAGEHEERAAGMATAASLLGIQRQGHVALTSGNSSTNSAPSPVGAGGTPSGRRAVARRCDAPGRVRYPTPPAWSIYPARTAGPASPGHAGTVVTNAQSGGSGQSRIHRHVDAPPRPESASSSVLITARAPIRAGRIAEGVGPARSRAARAYRLASVGSRGRNSHHPLARAPSPPSRGAPAGRCARTAWPPARWAFRIA